MSVKLRKRKNKDGSVTPFLDIYKRGEKRRWEFLTALRMPAGSGPTERQVRKELWATAERIQIKRAMEVASDDYDVTSEQGKNLDVLVWMENFVSKYDKADKRMMKSTISRFQDFLTQQEKPHLPFKRLDKQIIEDFRDYLKTMGTGEGPASYFSRFKRMIKHAHEKKVIKDNPGAYVEVKAGKAQIKDVLTLEEVTLLSNTETDAHEMKRAFLFCCMTGLRWSDVKALKWAAVSGDRIKFVQRKTENENGHVVEINLNDRAKLLIGTKKNKAGLIFNLPTANGANKALKAWATRAGIEKHITWHCARHTFGTLIVFNGAGVVTAARLLGHTTIKHTERYVRAVESMKEKATHSINF